MNDIANELINEIMLLGEAGKKPAAKKRALKPGESSEHPGYYHRGRGYYSNVSKDGTVTHKTDDTGKMVALSPKEKAAKNKDVQQPEQPEKIGSRTGQVMGWDKETSAARAQRVFGGPNPDSPVPDETLDKAVKLLQKVSGRTSGVFGNLLDAIKNGDVERMKYEVEALGLRISSTDRLVSTVHGDVFGKKETGKNALRTIGSVLSRFGIELERKKAKSDDAKPKVSKEEFKPTKLTDTSDFPEAETTTLTYPNSTDIRGFSVDGADYRILRRDKQRLVETDNINEILMGQGMPQPEAEKKAEEYDQMMASHNQQVRYLASKIRGDNGQAPVKFKRLPAGKEGKLLLRDKLLKLMLENSELDTAQQDTITKMLTSLSEAETTEEFDAAWETFRNQIENDPTLRPAIPYICEDVEMLRKAVSGYTILIPLTDTFKTADVVAVGPPLDKVDVDNIDSVFANIRLIQVQVDLRSVKSLEGGASVMGEKTELTLFDTEERKTDLVALSSTNSHTRLWSVKSKEEFDVYAEEQLKRLERYLPDIIAYYKLPEGTTFEEVVAILSGGSPPRYDRNGNYVGAGKPSGAFDEEITDLNRLQLRMYSLIGFASDAIYNRGAQLQGFTNTTFYDDGIVETDGRSVMGRSVFQFNKKLSRRTGGVLRDDGFASKVKPTPKENMGTYR